MHTVCLLSTGSYFLHHDKADTSIKPGERGGSVVECRTPEREVRGSRPTVAVLCPWARHFTPRKYWLITQEAMAPSRHDWEIVDWDVKPQHNQPKSIKPIKTLNGYLNSTNEPHPGQSLYIARIDSNEWRSGAMIG